MRFLWTVLVLSSLMISGSWGQNVVAPNDAPEEFVEEIVPLKEAAAALEIDSTSFFTDMAVTAVVKFPELVSEPLERPGPESDISLITLDIVESYSSSEPGSYATISFLPRHTGSVTVPSLEFQSETTAYRTEPVKISVSAPVESEAMTFTMTPAKTTVYAGEPLRIDVTWTVDLLTNQIRSLRCFPEIFSYPESEIVIPRNTSPEDLQMGMPFGGRRIIAKRLPPEGVDPNKQFVKFGTVSFPLFVKFHEPGTIELPAARLEVAHLKGKGGAFAPYAAYFNNGLFEPLTALEAFDRYFVEAPALTIEVLPLPVEGRTENFSGLFAPCTITASVEEEQLEVGEVVEVKLRVQSQGPHGMLDLPVLGVQRALRGRFRAGTEYGRAWLEDGTGFLGRVRALSTDVTALPSLQFQIFDPETGRYQLIQTDAQALTVEPQNGVHFFDIRSLAPETTFTRQPEGVWHNAQSGTMRDVMNLTIGFLAEYLWLLLLLGPIAYVIFLPWVKERRRRAINPVYRSQAEAYEAFRQLPERGEAKWNAFRHFLATSFSMPGGAWTPGDTAQRLRDSGIAEDDIQRVLDTHAQIDATDFSSQKPQSTVPELNALARRLFDHFKKTVPALVAGLLLFATSNGLASDWDEAEVLFEQALAATPGEPATESLFTQSALKFESAATGRKRPGASWFNAGNAWFKAGEIGRAISGYRQARIYRPFDENIKNSLDAARALSVDVVEDKRGLQLDLIPVRWLSAGLIIAVWVFVALLLVHRRFKTTLSLTCVILILVEVIVIAAITAIASSHSESEGVVIAGSLYGRKGPAYNYEQAFNESLHDGLEFRILDERDEWLQVQLADERQCWIPADQVRRIRNGRK